MLCYVLMLDAYGKRVGTVRKELSPLPVYRQRALHLAVLP